MVILPYGDGKTKVKNIAQIRKMAQTMVDAIKKVNGLKFTFGNSVQLMYPTYGASDDWAHSSGIPWTFGYEVRPGQSNDNGFTVPASNIKPSGEEIFASLVPLATEIMKESPVTPSAPKTTPKSSADGEEQQEEEKIIGEEEQTPRAVEKPRAKPKPKPKSKPKPRSKPQPTEQLVDVPDEIGPEVVVEDDSQTQETEQRIGEEMIIEELNRFKN
jgi:outer membrane biosynthesis protein TonB